jgi:hypothetical protein
MHNDDVCSLMNPFSKASLELPKLAKVWRREIHDPESRFDPMYYKLVVVGGALAPGLIALFACCCYDHG